MSAVDLNAPRPQEVLSVPPGAQTTRTSRAHSRVRSFALLDSSILNPQVTYRFGNHDF